MCHALIIDDNMIVSHAVQRRLETLGFNSFDKTWTEAQAVVCAGLRHPDLIVIGDEVEPGTTLATARRIARGNAVPVLMVTGDAARARKRIEHGQSFAGPFLLNQVEEAAQLARAGTGVTSAVI